MAMHEKVNDKAINLAVSISKLTAAEIKKAVAKLLTELETSLNGLTVQKEKADKTPELKQGKQTLKQLSKHRDGLSTVELNSPDLRLLYRSMKRHNVDFAAVKDGKGKYTLFFKGKDADSVTHAFKQYTQKLVNRANAPSIGKMLAAAKQAAQALNAGRDKAKTQSKGARSI